MPRLLQMISLSMLIGGTALISGAYLLSPSPLASDRISERQWEVSDIIVVAGQGSLEGGHLTITLDERGLAILSLPVSPIASEQYEILHIEFKKAPRDIRVVMLWTTDATGSTLHSKTAKGLTPKSLWLKVREMEDWGQQHNGTWFSAGGRPERHHHIDRYIAELTIPAGSISLNL